MANSIKVIVNTGKQETTQTVDVIQGNGDAGKPTRIKAVKGARYQLEDPALKNTGPQHLRTKRIGKSLHITLDGSTDSDLIIDDYYDEAFQGDGGGGLYGRAEDGSIYEYIPQDASQDGKLIELADGGSPTDQVLGADPVEDFELSALPLAAAAGGGLGVGGVAAGVAGAGALAGGGGGGGGGAGTTATTAEADAALSTVKNFAENNSSGLTAATGTAPTEATYSTAGVTGVTTQNLVAINSALASAAVNGTKVDTVAKLQALVDAYRAILDEANSTAEDATPNVDPSAAQYEAVGVTGVDAGAEETLLGDVIGSKVAADVDTVEELQALADAVGATVGYTGTQPGPGVSQLNALTDASSVTPDNLAAVQAAIAKANASSAPITSQAALKAIIDTATQNYQAALDAIKAAAENNTATQANPSVAQYEALGIHGVSGSNLAAINTALDSAAVNAAAADTATQVQALVDSYNTILAAADGVDKNTGSVPTQTNYANVGVTGVDTKVKADLLSDVVDGKANADVDTVQELQDLANAVGATVGYTGNQTAPSASQINSLIGGSAVTSSNLAAVQVAIAEANKGSTPIASQEQLQALVVATLGSEAQKAAQAALDAAAAANAAKDQLARAVGTLTDPATPGQLGAVETAQAAANAAADAATAASDAAKAAANAAQAAAGATHQAVPAGVDAANAAAGIKSIAEVHPCQGDLESFTKRLLLTLV